MPHSEGPLDPALVLALSHDQARKTAEASTLRKTGAEVHQAPLDDAVLKVLSAAFVSVVGAVSTAFQHVERALDARDADTAKEQLILAERGLALAASLDGLLANHHARLLQRL